MGRRQRGTSAYMQLYEQLRQQILDGAIPLGARLPSKRELAAARGISVVTAEHAYALLCDEGYAEAHERSGYYAAFGGSAAPAAPRARLEDMRAGSGPGEDFPFSVWARTMRTVLADYDRRILAKSPNAGTAELRGAIAAWLERSRGMRVGAEQIVVGSGAEYLYGQVVQLLGRERLYALEEPCYEKIRLVYASFGAQTVPLPMGDDGIRAEALAACAAGALHVTPFHSYPSGVTASAAKRRAYAAWARERDAVLIEDDYEAEFAAPGRRIETVFSLAPERVIYLSTFTKLLAPGVRTGFMVLPEELLTEYRRRLDFSSCTVPVFEQLVLASFLDEGHLERYISRRRRQMKTGE